jgi:hypothetical protein
MKYIMQEGGEQRFRLVTGFLLAAHERFHDVTKSCLFASPLQHLVELRVQMHGLRILQQKLCSELVLVLVLSH